MLSKRSQEGYLLIDHSDSPGLSERDGFDPRIYGGGKKFEAAIYQCKHCQQGIVKNPLRQRARNYCRKCDRYICDQCELERVVSGFECRTFDKVIDAALTAVAKNRPLILPGSAA